MTHPQWRNQMQNQASQFGNVATINPQSETPTHIVKYRAVNHSAEKVPPMLIEERGFSNAEDAEAFATSLVVGCTAHPDFIHIYAETGAIVAVNMTYRPAIAPTAGPRPATNSR